jgi:hypothetical protein
MAQLLVHVLDEFAEDVVVVEVDGQPVARDDHVTTQLLLGHAATLTADVPAGRARVSVKVPTRALEATISVDLREETHILASIESGALMLRTTERAPGYM